MTHEINLEKETLYIHPRAGLCRVRESRPYYSGGGGRHLVLVAGSYMEHAWPN